MLDSMAEVMEMLRLGHRDLTHTYDLDMAFLLDNMFNEAKKVIVHNAPIQPIEVFIQLFNLEKVDYSKINYQAYIGIMMRLFNACIQVSYVNGLYKGNFFVEEVTPIDITFSLYKG